MLGISRTEEHGSRDRWLFSLWVDSVFSIRPHNPVVISLVLELPNVVVHSVVIYIAFNQQFISKIGTSIMYSDRVECIGSELNFGVSWMTINSTFTLTEKVELKLLSFSSDSVGISEIEFGKQ